jgi:hypothetical protein
MPESHPTDGSHALDAGSVDDRDARLEQLLLIGLDHYFAQHYEHAISVWTRCLFLDRNHARARAYIERARSALAERQRQSEELLHDGVAAFRRGDGGEARRLLRAAIDGGAPADEALSVLSRLDRLERADRPIPDTDAPAHPSAAVALPPRPVVRPAEVPTAIRHRGVGVAVGLLVAAASVCAAALAASNGWRLSPLRVFAEPQLAAPVDPTVPDVVPPIPRRGEMNLDRARALAAGGRLHDALAVLDRIRPTDAERGEADDLRADIQQQLLALVSAPPVRASEGTSGP